MQYNKKIIFQPSITMTHGRVFMTSPIPGYNNPKNNNYYYYLINYLIFIENFYEIQVHIIVYLVFNITTIHF